MCGSHLGQSRPKKGGTSSAPLAAKQIPLVRDCAQSHGVHCHLLAHRLILSQSEITADIINAQVPALASLSVRCSL